MAATLFECPVCGTRRTVDVSAHDRFICNPTHHHVTGKFMETSGCGKIIFLPGKHEPGANVAVAKEVPPSVPPSVPATP